MPDSFDSFAEYDSKEDTFFAVKYIFSLNNSSAKSTTQTHVNSSTLNFAFVHQVYCVIEDKSLVNKELKLLCKSNPPIFKTLFSHLSSKDLILCDVESFCKSIDCTIKKYEKTKSHNNFIEALNKYKLLAVNSDLSVFEDDILKGSFNISILCKYDNLTMHHIPPPPHSI